MLREPHKPEPVIQGFETCSRACSEDGQQADRRALHLSCYRPHRSPSSPLHSINLNRRSRSHSRMSSTPSTINTPSSTPSRPKRKAAECASAAIAVGAWEEKYDLNREGPGISEVRPPPEKKARANKHGKQAISPSTKEDGEPAEEEDEEDDKDQEASYSDSEGSGPSPSSSRARHRSRGSTMKPVAAQQQKNKKKATCSKSSSAGKIPEYSEIQAHLDDPIYDSCDEVRRKIRAYLRKGEINQSRLLKHLHVNSNSYYKFMGYKGPLRGGQNQTYRAAYAFFELQRIASKKPKSARRLEAEKAFGPAGRECFQSNPTLTLPRGDSWMLDRLGRIVVVRRETGETQLLTGKGTDE